MKSLRIISWMEKIDNYLCACSMTILQQGYNVKLLRNSAPAGQVNKTRRKRDKSARIIDNCNRLCGYPGFSLSMINVLCVAAPRSSSAGTNNLPPLTFHHIHGDNIRLCNGCTIARRHESFCKGVTFSARPVRVGEKVSPVAIGGLSILFAAARRGARRLWETNDSRSARETAVCIPKIL